MNLISNIDSIQISLDGFEEDHDYIRGKGTFRKIVNIINTIKQERGDIFSRIIINTVVTKRNIGYLERWAKFILEELEIPKLGFMRYIPAGDPTLELSANDIKVYIDTNQTEGKI